MNFDVTVRSLVTSLLLLVLALSAVVAEDEGAVDPTVARGDAYYRLMKAHLAAREGRFFEVLREIRAAVELQPDAAELHAESAALLLRLGQRNEADKLVQRALELDPDLYAARKVQAELVLGKVGPGEEGGLEEAIDLYESLSQDPGSEPEVLLVLAQLKLRARDGVGAAEAARKLADRRPGDEAPMLLLVRARLVAGQTQQALEELLVFLERNIPRAELVRMAEELAEESGGGDRLAESCRRLLEPPPDDPITFRVCGEALLEQDDVVGGIRALEQALELDPSDPSVRQVLARAFVGAGRNADAVEFAQALSEEFPGAIEPPLLLAGGLAQQGRVDPAVSAYREALRRAGESPHVGPGQLDWLHRRIARLLFGAERYQEALDELGSLADGDEPEALELRGRASIKQERLDDARKAARTLRNLGSDGPAALLEAELSVHRQQWAEASDALQEAVRELGMTARLRGAQLYDEANARDRERALLETWVAEEPDNPQAHFSLGGFFEKVGEYELAEASLRKVMDLEPGHAGAMNYLGYSLADRNERLDEALELVERALGIDPWNAAYLDSLGWVYFRLGRFEQARWPLEQAARELPTDPTVLDHLGDLYHRLGERDRAVATWQDALAAEPDDPSRIEAKLEDPTVSESAGGRDDATPN